MVKCTGMHDALADAGNWGSIDKTGLHSTPEVVNDALGPIPRTSLEKNLEPESELLHSVQTAPNTAGLEQSPPQSYSWHFGN